MSQEKAQLIAPQGHFTVPGLNVAGVVTASSFSGNCTGTASSITQGTNVVVGVMTASSFAGDVFGNAAGLSTTTAGLKLGIVTSTSFAGNFTGIGSGLTGTPNIVAGLVTASQFVGNTPGLAAGLSAGKNLAAGIITATTFYGDGSGLTGAGSTAFIRQSVSAAQTGTTNINLNDGNIIYYDPLYDIDTLTFSNVKTADDISIIRSLDFATSFSSGGVDFDGTGDYLTVPNSSDFSFGTGDFTIECWVYFDAIGMSSPGLFQLSGSAGPSNTNYMVVTAQSFDQTGWNVLLKGNTSTSPTNYYYQQAGSCLVDTWYHVALERKSSKTSLYIDGTAVSLNPGNAGTPVTEVDDTTDYDFTYLNISGYYDTSFLLNGKISNFRVVKGTAVYGGNFQRPRAELTNITNTKLLCCLSSSSTTAATVIPTGSITASGDPTATSVSLNSWSTPSITWPTSIIWNGGSTPTLASANSYSLSGQVFNLVTSDGGITWYGYEEVSNTLLSADYEIWVWGGGDNGKFGLNSQTKYSSPVQMPGTNWAPIYKDTAKKNGDWSAYVKTDGTLWSMGKNDKGQLGQNNQGSATYRSSPIQIPGTNWVNVSTGFYSNLAVKSDGTMWAWGDNSNGNLGLNQTGPVKISSPTQIPGTTWSTDQSKFCIGYEFSAAIKTDGTLWMWGEDNKGQLGQNSHVTYSSPIQVGTDQNWRSIRLGASVSIGTKTDGTLWSWGASSDGIDGSNRNSGAPGSRSSPVQIPGTTWDWAGLLYRTGYATRTDGTLWTWGSNAYGQLGHNNQTKYSSPVQIPGTNWSAICAGGNGNCTAATKTDGTLWSWGYNTEGRLGLNDLTNRSSPTQIPGTDWISITSSGNSFASMKLA